MALWGNKDTKAVTGTIAVTNASGAVVGTSTVFTTQLKTGQTLVIDSVEYRIAAIASATALTITPVYAGSTASGLTVTANEQPAYISTSELSSVLFADAAEISAGGDNVVSVAVVNGGSGYAEVPGIEFTGGGGSGAAATVTLTGGVVSSIAVTNVGSSYETVPTVTIQAPCLTIPTSGITTSTDTISYTAHGQTAGAALVYDDGGSTAATGLTDGTTYYVATAGLTANAFKVKAANTNKVLAATVAVSGTGGEFTCGNSTIAVGDRVTITGTLGGTATITGYATGNVYKVSAITGTSPSVTGFTLTTEAGSALTTTAGTLTGLTYVAETVVDISGTGNNGQAFFISAGVRATATAAKGSGDTGTQVTHSGWVKRTVGSGGRAGRIQYETLVAMGTAAATSGDASDDLVLPD